MGHSVKNKEMIFMLPAVATPVIVPCVAPFNVLIAIVLLKADAAAGKDINYGGRELFSPKVNLLNNSAEG
ncbi:MAG: hypothetical protein BGP14_01940 [Sphingobacteriales bacterium 44-15]|nr:MAG: hypothetical protein BGP14_01940 [Sphingobacteriales bacterium 44-15]